MAADIKLAKSRGWTAHHLGTTIIPCTTCGGEGDEWTSRYGGNDPDVWRVGPCKRCSGSGNQACEDCGENPAVASWTVTGKHYLICRACHDEWLEDDAP